jgi:protein phosphatase 2C family protein 2/3
MSDIDTTTQTHDRVTAATASTIGGRWDMEDAHRILLNAESAAAPSLHYAAVFDGHGGKRAALWAADHLHGYLAKLPDDSPARVHGAFLEADADLRTYLKGIRSYSPDDSGTTVAAVVITPFRDSNAVVPDLWRVTTAHAGDSRVLLVTPDGVEATRDHKPDNEVEERRIRAAGGTVSRRGACARVDGTCAVSRALGDFSYKQNGKKTAAAQRITALPDVEAHQITSRTRVVVACDGLFEKLTNDQVAETVRSAGTAEACARALVERALKSGSRDNISVIAIWLEPAEDVDTAAPTRATTPELLTNDGVDAATLAMQSLILSPVAAAGVELKPDMTEPMANGGHNYHMGWYPDNSSADLPDLR